LFFLFKILGCYINKMGKVTACEPVANAVILHCANRNFKLDSAITDERLYISDAVEQAPGMMKVTGCSPSSQAVTLTHVVSGDPAKIGLNDAIAQGLYISDHCFKCGSGAQHKGCIYCKTGGKSRHPRSRSRHPHSRRRRSRHCVSTKRRRRN
jgi:hypothetical protein